MAMHRRTAPLLEGRRDSAGGSHTTGADEDQGVVSPIPRKHGAVASCFVCCLLSPSPLILLMQLATRRQHAAARNAALTSESGGAARAGSGHRFTGAAGATGGAQRLRGGWSRAVWALCLFQP